MLYAILYGSSYTQLILTSIADVPVTYSVCVTVGLCCCR